MNSRSFIPSLVLALGAAALAVTPTFSAQAAPSSRAVFLRSAANQPNVLYTLKLPKGRSAVVHRNGLTEIYTKNFRKVETRVLLRVANRAPGAVGAPTKADIRSKLSKASPQPYARSEVIVAFARNVHLRNIEVPARKLEAMRAAHSRSLTARAMPHYSSNPHANAVLARLGVDRVTHLPLGGGGSHANAFRAGKGRRALDLGNVYKLHITGASVEQAVKKLRHSGLVAYASPAFYISPMHTISVPAKAAPKHLSRALAEAKNTKAKSKLPSNYALQSSLQSLFNTPSLNAAAAYDEIKSQFHQLPGKGEVITNISLGDLDDASAGANRNDPCWGNVLIYGPTTIVKYGQRYLNWPSMPLIPTYTASDGGQLNGLGEVCGVDRQLTEVGLDFSMMAPLPHDQQRPGEVGSGLTDLLGIAPGAKYRLVVPASNSPTIADIVVALLAAAHQSPHPDVITMSLGFSEDQMGFPTRYLGDNRLVSAVVAQVVNSGIVVCISSGDGLRTYTNAAVAPSGGSAPTNLAHGDPTNL